jgi:hypothetical protein
MKIAFSTLCMFLLSSVLTAQTVPVTFQVDLRIKAKETLFNPATDSVTMHGDFMTDAGLGSNWFPGFLVLKDGAVKDSIYSVTLDMPTAKAGTIYHYKFTMNDVAWEGDPNREFTLASTAQILPVVLFDRDSVVNIPVTNTLNFTADLSKMYGAGKGYFDPATDSLLLMGLDWTGATVTGGVRKFVENPFKPGIFTAQMIIKGFKGDSTKWKTKAYPDEHFANTGWEVTSDKWYTLKDNGTVTAIQQFVPDIFPLKNPTTQNVQVLFQVNMTSAKNRYTGKAIDPKTLTLVGIKGQNAAMGAWVGDWATSDTTAKNLIPLNDKGLNGDKVAGDNVWSTTVTIPSGDPGGPYLYKYGAFYPGSDTLNSGFHPGDNEFQDGFNHYFNLIDAPKISIYDYFNSTVITAVKRVTTAAPANFELGQNYPNPFNPSTKVQYTVPATGNVTLSLFNLLGEEVATIVNETQHAGTYVAEINASRLASGVYFYRLATGSFTATKKMILMK